MSIRPIVGMRLEPGMLPGLIAAYETAATDMLALLGNVRDSLRLKEPWAGDSVSRAMFEHYNEEIVVSQFSALADLQNYERELRNISIILRQMQADYLRTENENTIRP